MKKLRFLSAAAMLTAVVSLSAVPMVSCCPSRRAAAIAVTGGVSKSATDSVRSEIRVRREVVRDTLRVFLPRESERVSVRDTLSRLRTSLAESEARINPDGTLSHSLRNRVGEIAVSADREIVTRDSIVWRDRTEVHEVEVPRVLTRWQRIRLHGFWFLLLLSILLLRGALRRIF